MTPPEQPAPCREPPGCRAVLPPRGYHGPSPPRRPSMPLRPACLLTLVVALAAQLAAGDDPKPKAKPNRLAKESSPYLPQHATNPVDGYAWGQEAVDRAKNE